MYALSIVVCTSYEHGLVLRRMLEGDGFPAVAATIKSAGGTANVVLSAAPHRYPDILSPIARAYSMIPTGLATATETANKHNPNHRYAVPASQRNTVRHALVQSVYYAADSVVASEPTREETKDTIVDHDPGDEQTTPGIPGITNPSGGGWDCGDSVRGPQPHTTAELRDMVMHERGTDDDWKPGRDLGTPWRQSDAYSGG